MVEPRWEQIPDYPFEHVTAAWVEPGYTLVRGDERVPTAIVYVEMRGFTYVNAVPWYPDIGWAGVKQAITVAALRRGGV